MKKIYFLMVMVFVAFGVFGQVSITSGGTPFTENFDGLTTSTFNLTNNSSITGVYAFRTAGNATPNVFTADNGGSSTGRFNNYGTTSASDRALGSVSSGTPGTLYYGVRYINNTGSTITSISVTYTGEQWRNGGNTTAQVLAFDYRQAASITDLTTGTYTAVSTLNFTTPINTATAAALDGNNAANRSVITTSITVNIPVGEEIMLRWTDINDAGNDHGVSIDDLSITATVSSPCSGAPSVQAGFGTITPTSVTADINVTAGTGGTGRVVKINTANSFVDMVDGANPAANTVYGGGEQVIFNGTGTGPVTVTSLTASTTYWLAVYEYNCAVGRFYLNPGATTSFMTNAACAGAPSGQAGFGTITPASFSADINVTAGTGGVGRVLKMNTANSFMNMVDGTDPTANTVYSGGEQVIFNGTGTGPVNVSGLTASTTYYLGVYEYNCVVGRFYLNPAVTTSFMTAAPPAEGLQITATNTGFLIDFDNTVANVNNGQFNAQTNFAVSSPASGQLNSNAWAYSSSSTSAASTFGSTIPGGNGVNSGGTGTTGVFAATVSVGNNALAIQPASSTWTATGGNYTLKVQNQTGGTLTSLLVSYKIYVFNDQGRSTNLVFSTSGDNSTYNNVIGYDLNTPLVGDGTPLWKASVRQVNLTGLSIPVGGYYYLRFAGIDNGGSGSRDEIAFDDINIVANPTSYTSIYSGSFFDFIKNGPAQLSGTTTIETDINLNTDNLLIGNNNLIVGGLVSGNATGYIQTNGTGTLTINNITTGKTLPIGNTRYNPLLIENGSGHNWSARVADGVTADAGYNTDKAVLLTWNITPSVNPAAGGADITFQFDEAATPTGQTGTLFSTAENVQAWRRVTGSWIAAGTPAPVTVAAGASTVKIFGLQSFSDFGLANVSGPLPVSLLTFAGQKEGNANRLRWTTASEFNNRGFEVLRSADGVNYTNIGFVNSLALNGNSSELLNYSFTDNAVSGTRHYYRLRQVDFDSRGTLSQIVLIKGEKPLITTIDGLFPNPANSIVNVLVAATGRERVSLVISDMSGKLVSQKTVSVEAGSNTIPVDISLLNKGSYLVRLVCEDGCEAAAKFIKL